jgi:hypothetical protein
MYRRPKFLEVLLKIREEMAREADYDVDFFAEMVRSGIQPATDVRYAIGEVQNGGRDGRDRPLSLTRGPRSKKRTGHDR